MKGLRTRAVSAVIFVVLMVSGIYGGKIPMTILLMIINILCLTEFFNLVFDKNEPSFQRRKLLGICISLIPFLLLLSRFMGFEFSVSFLLLLLIGPVLLIFELFQGSKTPFSNVGNLLLGFVYITFSLLLIYPAIGGLTAEAKPNILMGTLILIWANDSFAYLTGSQIGKRKLFPRISPGKTWEGSLGGLIGTLVTAFIIARFFKDLTQMQWLVTAGICTVFGTLGDLAESMLKRSKGVKDSGNLMPGHGGALDRFDAFLFAIPIVCFYLLVF